MSLKPSRSQQVRDWDCWHLEPRNLPRYIQSRQVLDGQAIFRIGFEIRHVLGSWAGCNWKVAHPELSAFQIPVQPSFTFCVPTTPSCPWARKQPPSHGAHGKPLSAMQCPALKCLKLSHPSAKWPLQKKPKVTSCPWASKNSAHIWSAAVEDRREDTTEDVLLTSGWGTNYFQRIKNESKETCGSIQSFINQLQGSDFCETLWNMNPNYCNHQSSIRTSIINLSTRTNINYKFYASSIINSKQQTELTILITLGSWGGSSPQRARDKRGSPRRLGARRPCDPCDESAWQLKLVTSPHGERLPWKKFWGKKQKQKKNKTQPWGILRPWGLVNPLISLAPLSKWLAVLVGHLKATDSCSLFCSSG